MTKIQLLLTYMIVLANSCSYLYNNTIFLTGDLKEVINVPLSSIFHSNYYERLTLKQTNNFLTITTPIQKYQEVIIGGVSNTKTVSQKLKKTTNSRDPLNHIIILTVIGETYYAESNKGNYLNLPYIEVIEPCQTKTKSICYDIIYIDKLTVIECDDEQKNSYFLVKNSIQARYLDVEKPTSDFRKMDQIDNYLFRGISNKIYIYVEEEGNLKYLDSLDENTLRTLLKKDSFKLLIKDFQIHTNGQLSIMNVYGEIIIVQYKNNLWELIKIFETSLNDVKGYDYNIYTNTYAIISNTQILYQYGNKEQQIAEIQNLDDKYKIYITKRNILLLKNNTVTLLNEKLQNTYNLNMGNEQTFINTNPNAEGFIIITDTKLAAYAINNYYFLQLSLVSTIDKDYYKATLAQDNHPKNCEITVFYKTRDLGTQEIFQSQYSQGLIVGGINSDSDVIKLSPIYQGSNLKYQFQANSLIKIEIEKHKSFNLNGISDTTELGYRKILKGNGQLTFYLIQQDTELQVQGYLCEGTLQLSCKVLFTKDKFKKLQNSVEQIWWSNQESLFFAIFEEITITIYYFSTQTNNFEILTTINIESTVKQIVTDGFHLFVLINEQIKIYEITISDKHKLTNTFDVVAQNIYASENQKNQLFIEQGNILYMFDIEYDFQTLVWYGTIQLDYSESNLAIFANHFVIFTKPINGDQYIVTVFNQANKRNIYMEKQISFNHYSDIKLSTLDYSYDSNLFYIHGYNKQSSTQVILVYKVLSSSFDTLFYSINSTPTTLFSVVGNYILITDTINKQIANYYITGELLVSSKVNQNYEQISYTKQIQLDFSVKNDLSDTLVQSILINSVNRGGKIILMSDHIDLKYLKSNDTINCVDLGQDWYAGQVFDIAFEDQSIKNITLKPPLKMEKEILEFSTQIQEFNSNRLVQLMQNKLNLVNKENFTFQEFNLDGAYQFTSILLIVGENIFVQAETKESIWLRIIQCKNYQDCKLLDNKLQFQSQIKKVFIHQNNFFLYVGNYIKVYDTKGEGTNLELFELIQNFSQYVNLKQMEITHLQKNVYQFISIDNWGNPVFEMREINGTFPQNYFLGFIINTEIAKQKINLQEIQLSAGFVLRKNEIIIIFKNSASYSFNYEMDCSRNKLCEIIKFEFNGLYQQYQDWQLQEFYPSFQSNILQFIYFAKTHYELLIYDMETPSNNSKPKNAIARLAFSEMNFEQNFQLLSFVYTFNGTLHLLTSDKDQIKLQHYSLLRSYQLCTDESKFEDQVKFNISNTNYQISIEEKIKIEEYIPPSPEDKGGFPIWAIIVIILGILLIGVGLYIYCRQRTKGKQNTNLLLDS